MPGGKPPNSCGAACHWMRIPIAPSAWPATLQAIAGFLVWFMHAAWPNRTWRIIRAERTVRPTPEHVARGAGHALRRSPPWNSFGGEHHHRAGSVERADPAAGGEFLGESAGQVGVQL